MRTRNLLVIGCLAVSVMFAAIPSGVDARPVDDDGSRFSLAAPSVGTVGIGGTGFRRVADVVRQAAAGRVSPARALDPSLVALADDSSAFVDSDGRLLYVEQFDVARADDSGVPAPESAPEGAPEVAQGVYLPPGNTFFLNSRPGSTKTIFLDFDGSTVAGTAWNAQTGVASVTVAPYDYDGLAGRSATDELYIRAIWQAVVEDFAAFDVNVTTQQPSDAALYRSSAGDATYGSIAVITPDKWMPSVCGSGCGGVAYVGIFGQYFNAFGTTTPADRYYAPAWVFAGSLTSFTSVADTVSHEVGHNLDLDHDGLSGIGGCPSAEYFTGNGSGLGSWAPIMGFPLGRQYTQWSRGEYTCASNTSDDDVAIIGSKTGFVPDESNSLGNAVAIPTNETVTAEQIIGFAGDIDYFSIGVTTGYLRVNITRTTNATSLLPRLAILNGAGGELTSGFLTNNSSGFLEVSGLVPGTYYVSVTGAGFATPQTGFSNYASLGYYNVAAQTLTTPNPPTSLSIIASASQVLTASWSASSSLSSLAPITYAVSLCSAATSVCGSPVDTGSTSIPLFAPTQTGSYFVNVNARHMPGRVSADASSGSAVVLTSPIAPSPVRLVYDSAADTVTVVWAGGQEFSPVSVTGRTLTVVNRSGGATVFTQSALGAGGSLTFSTASVPDDVWLDASFVSQTAFGTPWNSSPPGPIGSVFLGRLAAPQASGTTVPGRPGAPQTPGTTVPGRTPAPQV